MNNYQIGYDKGYEDGSSGQPSNQQDGYHLLDMVTNWDKTLVEYERGYDEGYENGKAEWDSRQET